ncbi:hypothetical protein [Moritella sp.]|uniref:hypothetical protein n=1 Tax=Moritella sp. TaxID=78556 RepID=UPI001DC7ED00|nr:hypothetical protein [Moritella sp.]MCJ8348031.1 hypothetical protein [Moritella sp.]NQZ40296.1 hypothetical protein [Moritella sp.]
MKKHLFTIILSFSLLGCQTIRTSSTTNPEVNIPPIDSIVVFATNNSSLEHSVVTELNSQEVQAYSGKELSAFVNNWDEFKSLMLNKNITYLLLVSSQMNNQNSTMIGTTSHTNTIASITSPSNNSNPFFVSPNGTANQWNINSNSYTTTTPIYNSTNHASSEAMLINSGDVKVWFATINIEAQGTLYTGHNKMIKGLTEGIIDELKKNSLIKKH